jgi:hypothetical protein
MGLLDLATGGVGGVIGGVVGAIGNIIGKVIDNKEKAAEATAKLQELFVSGQLTAELEQLKAVTSAQSDVNKIEAASTSLFIAGWRPFVGWICGVGLGMSCIVAPLFTWVTTLCGHPTPFPDLNNPILQSTLAGMLGLGYGLRTYEKLKDVASNH